MRFHLVSRKGRKKLFGGLQADHEVVMVAPAKLEDALGEAPEDSFFYLDAASFSATDLISLVSRIAAERSGWVGVLDPDGSIDDPALVFFAGGSDYLPAAQMESVIPEERLERLIRYIDPLPLETDGSESRREAALIETFEPPPREIRSGRDWSGVQNGNEYTFWFLYAHLEDTGRYTVKTSAEFGEQADQQFRDQLVAECGRFGGRIWMWQRFSGLLLFPFDGERCMPIIPMFRLVMNRAIYTTERTTGKYVLSFRLALHLGNSTYREVGDTGEVVSDDVNYIYHLGAKNTASGQVSVTRTALSYVPAGLHSYFVPAGIFEGQETYAMKRFIPGALDV